MLRTLAIANYRSLRSLVLPLGQLNLITGPNGSGKSNLYRALRLLAETAQGSVVSALAHEGGLSSTLWAGPENISRRMRQSEVPVQGGPRQKAVALKLGFAGDDFGYAIDLGLPIPSSTVFLHDPVIKREVIWAGPFLRSANTLVDRRAGMARLKDGRSWRVVAEHLNTFESMFTQMADPERAPEVMTMREAIRGWRFYDHFRSDRDAPARSTQLGTRTPVLNHDGSDLAAAWQTICEIGDPAALDKAVEDAFPGACVYVEVNDGRFGLMFRQHGLLRPLAASELSDGTLRYLLWIAALHTPRPPPADGAERARDQPSPRSSAGPGPIDCASRLEKSGLGGIACRAPHRIPRRKLGLQCHRARKGPEPDICRWTTGAGQAGMALAP